MTYTEQLHQLIIDNPKYNEQYVLKETAAGITKQNKALLGILNGMGPTSIIPRSFLLSEQDPSYVISKNVNNQLASWMITAELTSAFQDEDFRYRRTITDADHEAFKKQLTAYRMSDYSHSDTHNNLVAYLDNFDSEGLVFKPIVERIKNAPSHISIADILYEEMPKIHDHIIKATTQDPESFFRFHYFTEQDSKALANAKKEMGVFVNRLMDKGSDSLRDFSWHTRQRAGFLTKLSRDYDKSIDLYAPLNDRLSIISKNGDFFVVGTDEKSSLVFDKLEGIANVLGFDIDVTDPAGARNVISIVFNEGSNIKDYSKLPPQEALKTVLAVAFEKYGNFGSERGCEITPEETRKIYHSFNENSPHYTPYDYMNLSVSSRKHITNVLSKIPDAVFDEHFRIDRLRKQLNVAATQLADGSYPEFDFHMLKEKCGLIKPPVSKAKNAYPF